MGRCRWNRIFFPFQVTQQPLQKGCNRLINGLTWRRVRVPWFSWILSRKFHLDSVALGAAAGGITRLNLPGSCWSMPSTLTERGRRTAGSENASSAACASAVVAERLVGCGSSSLLTHGGLQERTPTARRITVCIV